MAAASWLGTIFNFLAGASYNPTPNAITAGSSGPLQCDQYGVLLTRQAAITAGQSPGTLWYDSGAATQKSAVIKAAPGNLYQIFGSNEGASSRWLMIFDASAVPGSGAPKIQFPVAAGATFSLDLGVRPRAFAAGICFAVSTTAATLTQDASGTFWVNAEYV